jgi:hypothetical protein
VTYVFGIIEQALRNGFLEAFQVLVDVALVFEEHREGVRGAMGGYVPRSKTITNKQSWRFGGIGVQVCRYAGAEASLELEGDRRSRPAKSSTAPCHVNSA